MTLSSLFLLAIPSAFANETLIWSDEFDEASCVDGKPGKDWQYETGFVRNEEDQWYQDGNAACINGELVITARREWGRENPNYVAGSSDWKKARRWVNYTSSSLRTKGRQEWALPVTMEMRAKIDVRQGSWPAWWTIGANADAVGWPRCGEIDIMEYYHAAWQRSGMNRANVIYGDSPSDHDSVSKELPVNATWANSYHTWRLQWTSSSIELSMDGNVLNDFSTSMAGDIFGPNRPVFMIINQALGGCCGGDPSSSVWNDNPLEYHVDYVRVYRPSALQLVV